MREDIEDQTPTTLRWRRIINDMRVAGTISIPLYIIYYITSSDYILNNPTTEAWDINIWDLRIVFSYITLLSIVLALLFYNHKRSLLLSIILWTLLGVACYTIISALWGGSLFAGWASNKTLTFKELVSTTLTAVGGIGAVGYLVIKYREQASAEREEDRQDEREADEKLAAAVQQLGSEAPQVRIAGVYAMKDVALAYNRDRLYRRITDILCGYLRTDRSKYMASEHAVESAIWDVTSTLVELRPRNWMCFNLDLHKTTLTERIYLSRGRIYSINLQETTLISACDFTEVSVIDKANFQETKFSMAAKFTHTHLYEANFDNAHFKGAAIFASSELGGLLQESSFRFIHFYNEVDFSGVKFYSRTAFTGSIFEQHVSYRMASFTGPVDFSEVEFKGGVNFEGTMFDAVYKNNGNVSFPEDLTLTAEGLPKGAKWVRFNKYGEPVQ